jgi:hypothetical protein
MSQVPTSPKLPVDDGIVSSAKEFSDVLTQELTDDEIKRAFELTVRISHKWHEKFVSRFGPHSLFTPEEALEALDEFEEELKYELATKLHVFATVDATPIFEGQPPIVEFAGALPSHAIAKQGFDHERKIFEVKRATNKGEAYLGEKNPHAGKTQKQRERGLKNKGL